MNNMLNGLDVPIPDGWMNIPEYWTVKAGDKVAMVASTRDHTLAWLTVDETEIGKVKKFAGKIVIRLIVIPINGIKASTV